MSEQQTNQPIQNIKSKRQVLFISHDTVGDRMAGPGIRYSNIVRVLMRHVNIVFAIPSESPAWQSQSGQLSDGVPNTFTVARYQHENWHSIQALVEASEVVICSPDTLTGFPQLAHAAAQLAFDDYDPLLSEWLAAAALGDADWRPIGWRHRMRTLTPHFLCGDFFICASERQRDWLLGCLETMGRLNPLTYAEDPSFRRLVDVAPTGIPDHAPCHSRDVIKGVWPGIGLKDRVVLWGGGLWPWLDPLTAIRAVGQVCRRRNDVRLLFPGTRLPNPNMSGVLTLFEPARALAQELGLLDTSVFFGDWVPYDDWPNFLLESDVALTLHTEVLETRLAFRSRTLDYIWAGLATIATRGDSTSELIERYGLGVVVDDHDVQGVADALLTLLDAPRPLPTARLEEARRELNWETAMRPLIQFCLHPRRAPDRVAMGTGIGPPHYVDQIAAQAQQSTQELASLAERFGQENAAQAERFSQQLSAQAEQFSLTLAAQDERRTQGLAAVEALTTELENKVQTLQTQLARITDGPGWKLLGLVWPIRKRLLPPYSRRERIFQLGVQAIVVLNQEGFTAFAHKTTAQLRQFRRPGHEPVQGAQLPAFLLADGTACPQPAISVVVVQDMDPNQPELKTMMDWVIGQSLAAVEVAIWDKRTGSLSIHGDITAYRAPDVRAVCQALHGRYVCFVSPDLLEQHATYLEENLAVLESESLAFAVNVRGNADWVNTYLRLGRLPCATHLPCLRQVVHKDCLSADGRLDLSRWSDRTNGGEATIVGKVITHTTLKGDLEQDLPFESCATGELELRAVDNYLLAQRPSSTVAVNRSTQVLLTIDTVMPKSSLSSTRPTVIVVMPFLAVGGAERVALDMMRALCQEIRFVVFASERHDQNLGTTTDAFRQITPYVFTSADFLAEALKLSFLKYLLGRFEAQTLYIANGVGWVYDCLEELHKVKAGLRIVNQVYDHQAGWIARYDAGLVTNVDMHIGVNQKICAEYIKQGAPKDDVCLIENCVDTHEFDPSRYTAGDLPAIRRRLGLPPSGKIVTFIARIHPQKRPMDFVELARRFAGDASVFFMMVGNGMLADTVDQEIKRIGMKNLLRRQFYDPSRDIYAVSDVIVLPSEYEGMPVVVLEAQAMGKPVVVTDVGNTREVLNLTGGGVVVNRIGDVGALSAGVVAMLNNPPDPLAMRARVSSHFGPAPMASKYRRALLGGGDA